MDDQLSHTGNVPIINIPRLRLRCRDYVRTYDKKLRHFVHGRYHAFAEYNEPSHLHFQQVMRPATPQPTINSSQQRISARSATSSRIEARTGFVMRSTHQFNDTFFPQQSCSHLQTQGLSTIE